MGLDGTKARMRCGWLDQVMLAVWPTMFGYKFIVEATPDPT